MVVKLLHISDLHVSAFDANNGAVAQKIAYIKAHYPNHHYVITGDLIDNEGILLPGTAVPVNKDDPHLWPSVLASPPPPFGPLLPHLQIARQGMQKAFALIAQLPLERTYICAGNHDYGLWGNVYADEFCEAFNEILWQPINGTKTVTQLGVLDTPFRLPHLNARTPVMFTIQDGATAVQLVFLDTNPETGSGTLGLMASGMVGGGQLNKYRSFVTAELLSPFDPAPLRRQLGIVRLVAFHHHPWFHTPLHRINDADALLGVLRRTADLVLFGHKHVQKRYEPTSSEASQITYGGLASGWIRSETTAAEITVDTANSVSIAYVPII